jgi:hypothetical protein
MISVISEFGSNDLGYHFELRARTALAPEKESAEAQGRHPPSYSLGCTILLRWR